MTTKRLIFLIIIFLLGILIAIAIIKLNPNQDKLIDIIIAGTFPIIITFLSYGFQPLSNWLDKNLNSEFNKKPCKFYIYANTGTGKTSLINSWSTGDYKSPDSTKKATILRFKVPIYKNQYREVIVLDYKGQKPSQATTEFPREMKNINTAIFLVDFIGRFDEKGNKLDTQERQINWLKKDTQKKINTRINEHILYNTAGALEIIFSKIYSHNLISVRLLINKFDILESLINQRIISKSNKKITNEEYAKQMFKEIEYEISKACKINNITDFKVEVISAKKDLNTRKVLRDIINQYESKIRSNSLN